MELKLNVQGDQLEGKIDTFIEKINNDQIEKITKSLLTESFNNFKVSMFSKYVDTALEAWEKEYDIANPNKNNNNDWSKRSAKDNKQKELIKNRLVILESIVESVEKTTKVEVANLVANDEDIKNIIKETMDIIKKDLPKYILGAVQSEISSSVIRAIQDGSSSLSVANNTIMHVNNIQSQLLEKGVL